MLKDNTTLIIGAGCCVDFKYPSGAELYDLIAKMDQSDLDEISKAYCANNCSESEIEDTIREIQAMQVCMKFADKPSIDSFIESHKSNNVYTRLAKTMIAKVIYDREAQFVEMLFNSRTINSNWLGVLFNDCLRELDNLSAQDFQYLRSVVKIITFNYDLTLEKYLYYRFVKGLNKSMEYFTQLMNLINIVHVYGKINSNPWDKDVTKNKIEVLRNAPNNIRIIGEERLEISKGVGYIMTNSEYIHFLGFGYDEDNIKILSYEDMKRLKVIAGTVYGKQDEEIAKAQRDIKEYINYTTPKEHLKNMAVIDYIRSSVYRR